MTLAAALLALVAGADLPPPRLQCGARERPAPVGPADPRLKVRFMGTSTLLLDDGETQILFDGYFSRLPLLRSAVGRVRPHCGRIRDAIDRAGIDRRLRALFVAHAHIDHVLDAPEVAGLTGARLIGDRSVGNVAEGHGLPGDRFREIEPGKVYCAGAFRVTPIRTPHSTPNIATGSIDQGLPRITWAWRYRAEDSYAFLIQHGAAGLLLYPSAAYASGLLKDVRADVLFLGAAGLGRKPIAFVDAYWAEVVGAVRAKQVYPIHWDNFGYALGSQLKPMGWPQDDVEKGRRRLKRLAQANQVQLGDLPLFEPIPVEPATSETEVLAASPSGGDDCEIISQGAPPS